MSAIEKIMRRLKRDDALAGDGTPVPLRPVADAAESTQPLDTELHAELAVAEHESAAGDAARQTWDSGESEVDAAVAEVVGLDPMEPDVGDAGDAGDAGDVAELAEDPIRLDDDAALWAALEDEEAGQHEARLDEMQDEHAVVEGSDGTSLEHAPSDGDSAIDAAATEPDVAAELVDAAAVSLDAGALSKTPSVAADDAKANDIVKSSRAITAMLREHNGQLAEEYRRIKLPLLKNAFDSDVPIRGHRNIVMVTSSVPAEGKTFNSMHLAISVSMEKEKTVLLVDADLQMGKLSEMLGFKDAPGLSDYLFDRELDLSQFIRKTKIPNFSFIPAGQKKVQTAELLSSRLMKTLTDEIAIRYDDRLLVLDSAPLLASSEARILAGLVGQVALVVEAENTPRTTVEEALKHLETNDVVGLIFNKCPKTSIAGYYDAYYGQLDRK